ncbi:MULTISPECIES: hypothetical protein [Clostridia]|jgi:hypothetical protein|nr:MULTISPECIES: hypothetical protein [Clostridia]
MNNIPFLGSIYPFTTGTWITVAFWWLLFVSIIAAAVISIKFMD